MSETRELISRLLYHALVDIRMDAHSNQNSRVFHLADLFHNIPLQLERVAKGEGDYDEILSWLKNRAAEKGCEAWHTKAIESESK